MRFKAVLMLIFLFSLLNSESTFIIYSRVDKEIVNPEEMVAKIKESDTDVLFFGEYHDNSLLHSLEKEITEKLYFKYTDGLVISLEMFERDIQLLLNQFLSDTITEEYFLQNSRPWNNYINDYKPLVDFAKEKRIPVLAANIPRVHAANYRKSGENYLNSLNASDRSFIARNPLILNDRYKDKFYESMKTNMHSDSTNPMINSNADLNSLYAAQCLKDDTMAESIGDYFRKNTEKFIIHFNGDFHSNDHLGTAQKLALSYPEIKIGVISPVVLERKPTITELEELTNSLTDEFYIIIFPEEK